VPLALTCFFTTYKATEYQLTARIRFLRHTNKPAQYLVAGTALRFSKIYLIKWNPTVKQHSGNESSLSNSSFEMTGMSAVIKSIQLILVYNSSNPNKTNIFLKITLSKV